jgi:hypothetical protein
MRISTIVSAALLAFSGSSFAAGATLGQEPPADLIVSAGGMEWVYAGPCAGADPTCGAVQLHHGFEFASDDQWNASFASLSELATAFAGKCAAPYFNVAHNHCDFGDLSQGYVWHSPLAPDAGHRDHMAAETFLVRGSVNAVPEPETYALMLAGLSAVGWVARRRQRNAA